MPRYDFSKEVAEYARTGNLPGSFFKKLEALAKCIVSEKYIPACFIDPVATTWTKDTYQEFAAGFFVDFLCHGDSKRLDYLVNLVVGMKADVDYLIKKMFEQYRDELMKKNYPFRANINDRIRIILNSLTRRDILEERNISCKEYRKKGNLNDICVGIEDLMKVQHKLPTWKQIFFNPDSQIASALISNDDLEKIITALFTLSNGWITTMDLGTFIRSILNIPEVKFIPEEISGPDGETISLYEFISSGAIEADPSLLIKLKMAYAEMTPRQQKVFLLLCQGYRAAEIAAKIYESKSTIYIEIRAIAVIIKKHL